MLFANNIAIRMSCTAIGILRCDKSETIIESTLPMIFKKYRKVIGIKIVIITIWISVMYFVNGSKSLSFTYKKNKVPNSGINSGWKRYEKKGRIFFNSNNLRRLHFFTQTRYWNIKLLAVFCNGSSCNRIAFFFEKFRQLIVGKWFVFVFFFQNVFEDFFDF